jgi:hypothetical protein
VAALSKRNPGAMLLDRVTSALGADISVSIGVDEVMHPALANASCTSPEQAMKLPAAAAGPREAAMRSTLCAILALLWCGVGANAATFATGDFAVTLPDDWVEVPPEAVREFEAAISELSQGTESVRFDQAYQLTPADRWLQYPYVLVQVRRGGRVPEGELTRFERVESEFREGLERVEEVLGALVSGMWQGDTLYDDIDHVLWSTVAMDVEGTGPVRGLIAVQLTEFGAIHLMGYATEATFDRYAPVFREAVRTLVIAEPHRYRPRLTDHAPTIWGINLGQTAIAALVGGLGGVLAAGIGRARKRWGQRAT